MIGCVALTCCHDYQPAYLINESGEGLVVEVSMPRQDVNRNGNLALCKFHPQGAPFKLATRDDAYAHRFSAFLPAELEQQDLEKCTATVKLPPGGALLMFANDTCSNEADQIAEGGIGPVIDHLRITGPSHAIDLKGSNASLAFQWSWWDRDCKFVIK